MAAAPLLLERRHGLLEPFAQLHGFGGGPGRFGLRLGDDRRQQLVARAVRAQPLEQRVDATQNATTSAIAISRASCGLEGTIVGEREVRPGVPDEHRDQQKAEHDQERAALEK